MATAHLHINGLDYELARTWPEEDSSWTDFKARAAAFAAGGGPNTMTFTVMLGLGEQELIVRLGGLVTLALWLEEPTKERYAPRRLR